MNYSIFCLLIKPAPVELSASGPYSVLHRFMILWLRFMMKVDLEAFCIGLVDRDIINPD